MLGSFQTIVNNADEIIAKSTDTIKEFIRHLNEDCDNLPKNWVSFNLIEIHQPFDHEKVLQVNSDDTKEVFYDFRKNLSKNIETKFYRTDIYTAYFIKFELEHNSKKFSDILNMEYIAPSTVPLGTIKDIKKYDHIISTMDKLTTDISTILGDEFITSSIPSVV